MTGDQLRVFLLEHLESVALTHDIDIVDVEVVGSTKAPIIRLRIDHIDETLPTITLDEVSSETSWISEAIDELDPISSAYTLEVSSPGLARPLRKPHDFERFAHNQISLLTKNTEGRRRFSGELLGIENNVISVSVDGEEMTFPLDDIAHCEIKPEF